MGPDVVFTLPPLPDRPTPPSSDQELIAIEEKFTQAEKEIGYEEFSEQKRDEHLRIIKIAATSSSVLALRANGEVWVGAPSEDWQYVSDKDGEPCLTSSSLTFLLQQLRTFQRSGPTSSLTPPRRRRTRRRQSSTDVASTLRPALAPPFAHSR